MEILRNFSGVKGNSNSILVNCPSCGPKNVHLAEVNRKKDLQKRKCLKIKKFIF